MNKNGQLLSGAAVLVTGGGGVVGSHIVDRLVLERAGPIVVLDNWNGARLENVAWARAHGPVTLVEADILDRNAVAKAVNGIDFVFHQAAISVTASAVNPRLAVEVLVDGTYNVVEAAAEADVQKV